jgi:chromate transporter
MSAAPPPAPEAEEPTVPCTLGPLVAYFLRLGSLGFGGPIALTGYMQRDLVERRRWISKRDYVEGLALAQLAPGPLAAQLAIYLGWVRGGLLGSTLVALAFILPSFLMVLAFSWFYVRYGGAAWMQGAFYGIGAAVIAIIARSSVKLVTLTMGRDRLLWTIFGANVVATVWTQSEVVWLILACGMTALVLKARRRLPATAAAVVPWPWLITGLHGAAPDGVLWRILVYFAEAGAFVFGSGLAIVPFLRGGVVDHFHWLNDQQFLDAVAVAMITPGPVVITVAFIGYLVAGPIGATLAAIGVFVPCCLFVIGPAPYYRRFAGNTSIKAFVDGITAAAVGAIVGAVLVLGHRSIVDLPTTLILAVTLGILIKLKKAPEPFIILAAGVVGLALKGWAVR